MTLNDFKKAKDRRPFLPYTIHLADGREIQVRHPDALAWGGEDFLTVTYVSPEGDTEWIDVGQVASLGSGPAAAKRKGPE